MLSIGFIGFGEAAYFISKGLREEGITGVLCYDVALQKAQDTPAYTTITTRIHDAGVTPVSSLKELTQKASILVSAVPAQFDKDACLEALPYLTPDHLFIDVTTSDPELKLSLSILFAEKKIPYVDSAMLGPLPVYRHKVPMMASGTDANLWSERMTPYGMDITVVGTEPGEATRIKLARSLFTKGFEALLVETFLFARKSGIENIVMESIAETMDKVSFKSSATRYITGDVIHSRRRAHEAEEVVKAMKKCGIDPLVMEGALKRLHRSADMGYLETLGGAVPKELSEVYTLWEDAKLN